MATKQVIRKVGAKWEVLQEGHVRGTVSTKTKDEAVARAREIVKRGGGGEVQVVNRVGKIVDSATIPRAKRSRHKG